MSAQWGYRIPVLVLVLGACSVYDASLLITTGPLGGAGAGAAGESGSQAGSGGLPSANAGMGDVEIEAGAAGNADGGAPPSGGGMGGTSLGGSSPGGTSGSAGSAGSIAGGSAGTGGAPAALEFELIDDMENNDSVIDASNGRGGDWYAANDLTPGGTQTPSPFVVTALPPTDPRYDKSKFASMTSGMGFNDWGENLGFNLKLLSGNKHPAYDATAYCGVHFFGKTAAGASTKALLRIIDKNSHPDGGVCSAGGMPCYQYFQKLLTFTTAWSEQTVLFSDLTCAGWPQALVLKEIFSVEFGLNANSKFGLWVDDISFLKKPASGVCPK